MIGCEDMVKYSKGLTVMTFETNRIKADIPRIATASNTNKHQSISRLQLLRQRPRHPAIPLPTRVFPQHSSVASHVLSDHLDCVDMPAVHVVGKL